MAYLPDAFHKYTNFQRNLSDLNKSIEKRKSGDITSLDQKISELKDKVSEGLRDCKRNYEQCPLNEKKRLFQEEHEIEQRYDEILNQIESTRQNLFKQIPPEPHAGRGAETAAAPQVGIPIPQKKVALSAPLPPTAYTPRLKVRPNTRLFFDIFASPLGKETRIQGENQTRMVLDFAVAYMSTYPNKSPRMQRAFDNIKSAQAFHEKTKDRADFATELNAKLDTNQPFLWPGGWAGAPAGHTIYCEFIPDTATHGTLRFYNLGAGSEAHTEVGEKIMPYLDWKGVEIAKLRSPEVAQALWEMQNCLKNSSDQDTKYGGNDIYIALKNILNPQVETPHEVDQPIPIVKAAQEGENCTWKSLLAYLATQLSPQEYKKLITDMKIDILCDEAFSPQLQLQAEEAHTLLTKGIQHTVGYITKQKAKELLPPGFVSRAHMELLLASKFIANRPVVRTTMTPGPQVFEPNSLQKKTAGSNVATEQTFVFSQPISVNSYQLVKRAQDVVRADFVDAPARFTKLLQMLNQSDWSKEGLAIHQATFDFIKALPLDKPHLAPEEARQLLKLSRELIELYFRSGVSLAQNNTILQEREFIFRKIWHMQCHLNEIAFNCTDGAFFQGTWPHYNPAEWPVNTCPAWVPLDLEIKKQDLILRKHFDEDHPKAWLPKLDDSGEELHIKENLSPQFLDALQANYPQNASTHYKVVQFLNHLDQYPEVRAQMDTILYMNRMLSSGFKKTDTILSDANFRYQVQAEIDNPSANQARLKITWPIKNETPADAFDLDFEKLRCSARTPWGNFVALCRQKERKDLCESNLQKFSRVKGFAFEDQVSLYRVFSEQNTRFNDLLAYCQEHPHQMHEKKFQSLVLGFILAHTPTSFSPDKHELYPIVTLEKWLIAKFELLSKKEVENTATSIFLMRALSYLRNMVPIDPADPVKREEFPFIQKLERLIGQTEGHLIGQQCAHAELIAILGNKSELSEKEALLLAKSSAFLEANPPNTNILDPLWAFEIDKAKLKHAEAVLTLCRQNPTLINQIVKEEAEDWKETGPGHPGQFSSAKLQATFEPMTGTYLSARDNGRVKLLPPDVTSNKQFANLFPKVTQGKFCFDHFEFTDPKTKRVTHVYSNGVIAQLIPPHGLCKLFSHEVQVSGKVPSLFSKNLTQNYCHWITRDNTQLLCEDPETRKLTHVASIKYDRISKEWSVLDIHETETQFKLSSPSKLFVSIEDPTYIEQWHDAAGNLQKVTLPRLGITFTTDPQNPHRLNSKEYPGFYIDLNATTAYPIQNFHRGVVIRNDKGESKYLLPRMRFQAPLLPDVIGPALDIDFQTIESKPNSIKLYAFDITAENKLSTKSIESELYLASVYAISQNHTQAEALLRKQRGQNLSYIEFPQLAESLEAIIKIKSITGNWDGNTAALGAFAGYLLMQNGLIYPHELQKGPKLQDQIKACYERFLQKHIHTHVQPLQKEEELFLIEHFPKAHYVEERVRVLQGKPPVPKKAAVKKVAQVERTALHIPDLQELMEKSKWTELEQQQQLITRPTLATHLYAFYEMARGLRGSQTEKDWLRVSLEFALNSPREQERNLAALLKIVLANPYEFNNVWSYSSSSSWANNTLKKAQELSKKPPVAAPVKAPADFQIEVQPKIFVPLPPPGEPLQKSIEYRFTVSGLESIASKAEAWISKKARPVRDLGRLDTIITEGLKEKDPILRAKYEQLQLSAAAFKATPLTPEYTIENLPALTAAIQPNKQNIDRMGQLEWEILQRANAISAVGKANEEYSLLRLRGQLKPFSLDEMIVNFGSQKPHLLQRRNPTLDEEQITKLYNQIAEYLQIATVEQQNTRARDDLKKLADAKSQIPQDPLEIKQLEHDLAATCLAQRTYRLDPTDRKMAPYLVFEYFGDMLMRPKQIVEFKTFLDSGNDNLIRQMIMGSGKSKVLLPFITHLRANGKNISSMIVGSQFEKDVVPLTNEKIERAYGQTLKTIAFTRATPITEESLTNILNQLKSIQANEDALANTDKSLRCLQNRYIEEWCRVLASPGKGVPKELAIFDEIMSLLRSSNYPIMDEVDTLLRVLHTVSFSLGDQVALPQVYLDLTTNIYRLLYTDPALKAKAVLDSDPNPNLSTPPLTVERYHKEFKRPLAEKVLKLIPDIKFNDARFRAAAGEVSQVKDREALLDFLCQDAVQNPEEWGDERVAAAQNAYDSLPADLKPLISVAAMMISGLLDRALTKPYGEGYGFVPGIPRAIPFKAAGTPCFGSEFSHPFITVCLTVQGRVKEGIPTEDVQSTFENLFRKVEADPDNPETAPFKALLNTWYEKIAPLSITPTTGAGWQALADKINANPQDRLQFLEDFILPSLQFYNEKITSDPQDLIDMSAKVMGFSGTLDNASTFSHKLKVRPELGDDCNTITLLLSQFKGPATVVKDSPMLMLDAFQNRDMICDAGGNFKSWDNVKVAKEWAKRRGKPVVFYNKGAQTVTNGINEELFNSKNYPAGSFLVFLDQINTTGADLQMQPLATSVITVKKGMLPRDMLQAAWRLRGLDKSQTVSWAISEEVETLIRSDLKLAPKIKIGMEEIIKYAILNDAKDTKENNPRSFSQQLQNVKKQVLNKILTSQEPFEKKLAALSLLKSAWISSDISDPVKLFNRVITLEDSKKMRSFQIETVKQFLKSSCTGKILDDALAEVDAIDLHFSQPGMFPDKVPQPLIAIDDTTETETQTEKQAEKETEKETEVEIDVSESRRGSALWEYQGDTLSSIQFKRGKEDEFEDKYNTIPCVSLTQYFSLHPDFKLPLRKAFDGIEISLNFLELQVQMNAPVSDPNCLSSYDMYKTFQKPFDYMVFDQGKITLLSQHDAEVLSKKDPQVRANMFSLKTNTFPFNITRQLQTPEKELLVRVKFLAGISEYNKEDKALLENWLKANDPDALRELFENKVLKIPYHVPKRKMYGGSFLNKIFNSIASKENRDIKVLSQAFAQMQGQLPFIENLLIELDDQYHSLEKQFDVAKLVRLRGEMEGISLSIEQLAELKSQLDTKLKVEFKKQHSQELEEMDAGFARLKAKHLELYENMKQQVDSHKAEIEACKADLEEQMSTTTSDKGRQSLARTLRTLYTLAPSRPSKEVDQFMSRQIGPVGIPNVGNTCYMNAVLQGFLACPKVRAQLDQCPDAQHPIIPALRTFVQALDLKAPGLIAKRAAELRDACYRSGQGDLRGNPYQTQDADTILSLLGEALGLEYDFVIRAHYSWMDDDEPRKLPPEKKLIWDPIITSGNPSVQELFNRNCCVVTNLGDKREHLIEGPLPKIMVLRVGEGSADNIGDYKPYVIDLERDQTFDISKAIENPPAEGIKYTLKGICEREAKGNHWVSHFKDPVAGWCLGNDGSVTPSSPDGAKAAYLIYELQ